MKTAIPNLYTKQGYNKLYILLLLNFTLFTSTTYSQDIILKSRIIEIEEPAKDSTIVISYDFANSNKELDLKISDVTNNSATTSVDYMFEPQTITRSINPQSDQYSGVFKIIIKSDSEVIEDSERIQLLIEYKFKTSESYKKDFITIIIRKQEEKEKLKQENKAKQDKVFLERLREKQNEEETSVNVGVMSLSNNSEQVNVNFVNESEIKQRFKDEYKQQRILLQGKVRVDSVQVTIDKGTIARRGILVFANNRIYTNIKAPISLLNYRARYGDNLYNYDNRNKWDYIELGDVIKYISKGKNYIPDDIEDLIIKKENNDVQLSAKGNLNNLLSIAVYTDLAGLLGRKPNGLIQTDVSARFITNTTNIRNQDFIFVNFIEGKVTLSKFDSKFTQLDSLSFKKKLDETQRDTVNRSYLNQIAWLKGQIKVNIFRLRLGGNQLLYLNTGAQINVVNADSIYNKDLIFFNWLIFPEIVYSVSHLGNFSFESSLKWFSQRLSESTNFSNDEMQTIFSPQILFAYHPIKKPQSQIYLRFNYFNNIKHSENNFYQIQFGFKTPLNFTK